MNLNNILNKIENTDPGVFERPSERRQLLKNFGAKVLAAGVPLGIASLFEKASAQTGTSTVTTTPVTASASFIASLNFLLEMEFIEFNFFHEGNSTGNLIATADQPAMATIEAQDLAHITFLRNLIVAVGGTPFTPNHYPFDALTGNPYSPDSYDFTAGGTFNIYNNYVGEDNYPNYLVVAQAIKDTMVRAYQGQISSLFANTGNALTSVMQIISTEGRHASHIRLIRRFYPAPEYPKPWITNNIPPSLSFQQNYLGEDNVQQEGITITNLIGSNGIGFSETAATEAFDEPLTSTTVLSLFSQFILA